jgi:hypothetical protein
MLPLSQHHSVDRMKPVTLRGSFRIKIRGSAFSIRLQAGRPRNGSIPDRIRRFVTSVNSLTGFEDHPMDKG